MVKYKVEWSIEARLDLLDILNFYIDRNKSAIHSKKLRSRINSSIKLISKNVYKLKLFQLEPSSPEFNRLSMRLSMIYS
jgi:hypothetical protein